MNTLADRIKALRIEKGINQSDLAKRMAVTRSAVSQWESGLTKSMDGAKLVTMARILDVSSEWLATGKGDKMVAEKPVIKVESNAAWSGGIEEWDNETPLHDDEVELPFFIEVEASAGNGRAAVQESHGPRLRFSKSTLRKQCVEPKNAVCIKIAGNSMEPALPSGATIGIDRGATAIIDGKVYAIDHDGELRVKCLYKLPGGGIRLRSYNSEEYPDERYDGDQAKVIRVLGRVFWSSVLW